MADYSSQRFYNGMIRTDKYDQHPTHFHETGSGLFGPLVFHDIQYGQQHMEGGTSQGSYQNGAESKFISLLLNQFYGLVREPKSLPDDHQHSTSEQSKHMTIGIIAPYSAQRRSLKKQFQGNMTKMAPGGVTINLEISTIDGFQGREKDIVIFSCVRAPCRKELSSDEFAQGIGFLKEWQRLNVAITRARHGLWIVGHAATLRKDGEWASLLQYISSNG